MPDEDESEEQQMRTPVPTEETTVWRKVGVQIEDQTYRRLKRYVAAQEVTMREVITRALDDLFEREDFH